MPTSPYDTDCPHCHSMNFELVDENVYDEVLWFRYECKLCAARWEAPLALDPFEADEGLDEAFG